MKLGTLVPRSWRLVYRSSFFLSGFSFTGTDNSQHSRGREGTIFFSTLPLPPAHEHSSATLHVRWLSHNFNCNACIYQTATRWDLPPYQITIWLTDDVDIDFCLLACWIDFRFCYSYLTWETSGLELASVIILVLQANRLTKYASLLVTFYRSYGIFWQETYLPPIPSRVKE